MEDFENFFNSFNRVQQAGADELCVHALLSGYHQPKFDKEKIVDMFIADAYRGKIGLLYNDEVEVALSLIKELLDSAKTKGLEL